VAACARTRPRRRGIARSVARSSGLCCGDHVRAGARPPACVLHVQPGLLPYAVQVFGLSSMSVTSQTLPRDGSNPRHRCGSSHPSGRSPRGLRLPVTAFEIQRLLRAALFTLFLDAAVPTDKVLAQGFESKGMEAL
jgi:hypothetical protein